MMVRKILKYGLIVFAILLVLLIIFRWWALLYLFAGFMDNPHLPLTFKEWKEIISWIANPTH